MSDADWRPWVARHWPAGLVQASLPFFALQPVLNGEFASDPVHNLPLLDAVLRQTDLRIPVLWLLGSDVTEQEIVNRRLAADGYSADYAYALGARALAERDYATAGKLFADAAAHGSGKADAFAAYSRCRANSRDQAERCY